jgi:hypothetical protein
MTRGAQDLRRGGRASAARGRAVAPLGALALAALAAALSLATAAVAAPSDDVEGAYHSSAAERDLARLLAGRAETDAFVFHFRPGTAAEAGRAGIEAKLAPAWKAVCAHLELSPAPRLDVFIYETGAEMARLTGRASEEAAAIDGALHVALDRASVEGALARLAEAPWGRAGDKLGGSLEPARWHKVSVRCRAGGKLEVAVDERKLAIVGVPESPGAVGFGVEEGRLGVRGLKVRALPAEDQPLPPFTFPLRPAPGATPASVSTAIEADVPGRWRVADEELEGVRYGRASRVRLAGPPLRDVEVECELRVSEGATAEVDLHASGSTATRVIFAPGVVYVAVISGPPRRLAGPHTALREGLAAAIAATLTAEPIHELALALVSRGLTPGRDLIRTALPSGSTERDWRGILLGSFVLDALESYGPSKYRDLHFFDMSSSKTPLGDAADLERDWRAHLVARRFSDEAMKQAERRLGIDLFADASAWREASPARLRTDGPGDFTIPPGVEGELDWAGPTQMALQPGRASFPEAVATTRCAARLTVRLGDERSRAAVVLRDRDGARASAALVTAAGVQLVGPDGVAAAKAVRALDPGRWYDVAVALDGGGAARIYVDGELATEAATGLAAGPGRLAIELEGKRVDLRNAAMRGLE